MTSHNARQGRRATEDGAPTKPPFVNGLRTGLETVGKNGTLIIGREYAHVSPRSGTEPRHEETQLARVTPATPPPPSRALPSPTPPSKPATNAPSSAPSAASPPNSVARAETFGIDTEANALREYVEPSH